MYETTASHDAAYEGKHNTQHSLDYRGTARVVGFGTW